MIRTVDKGLLTDIEDYSVILHQCNAKGWMEAGLASAISKRWPENFEKYHGYCRSFSNGHEQEILGTFVPFQASSKLIICNAIAQITVGKTKQQTDYDAWEIICKKIELQTRSINKNSHMNWTIHALDKIGCGLGNGNYEHMHEIFDSYFKDSPVQLVFHAY